MPDERDEEKKPRFRIIDKRGEEDTEESTSSERPVNIEASPQIEEEAMGEEPEDAEDIGKVEMSEEEREKLKIEAAEGLKFRNTVIFLLRTLSEQTWIHLGLIPNPITNLTVKNLDEAKKSIDLIEVIINHVEPDFDAKLQRELQTLLSDLRLNYANQLG